MFLQCPKIWSFYFHPDLERWTNKFGRFDILTDVTMVFCMELNKNLVYKLSFYASSEQELRWRRFLVVIYDTIIIKHDVSMHLRMYIVYVYVCKLVGMLVCVHAYFRVATQYLQIKLWAAFQRHIDLTNKNSVASLCGWCHPLTHDVTPMDLLRNKTRQNYYK